MVKVSVVMSLFNENEFFLKNSIESILKQTFNDFELILVLDNPNNEIAKKLLKKYSLKKNIKVIYNEINLGRATSRNKAIKIAKGKYIAILDGDDIAMKSRLEKQYTYMEQNTDVDLLFSWVKVIDENNKFVTNINFSKELFKNINKNFFKYNLTVHPSMMIKKNILLENKYDKKFLRSQDYEFWVRCLKKGYQFGIIEEYLIKYRVYYQTFEKRLERQKGYSKYGFMLFTKNFKYFWNNRYYLGKYLSILINYIIVLTIPNKILLYLVKLKDKIQNNKK